jgi:transitional endoplasmic reticulum ATPase
MFGLLCQDMRLDSPAARLAAELTRLPVLTPGDFALVARQHRFRKLRSPAQVIEVLRSECAAKRQRIGFL